MKSRVDRRFLATAGAALVLIAFAGCSTPTAATKAPGAGTSAGSKEAAAFVAENLANPTSIVIDTPLEAAPQPGRHVIELTVPLGSSQHEADAEAAAAAALGWTHSIVDVGSTPTSAVAAFEAAIAQKPDAITYSGYPASLFAKQIKDASAADIAVVAQSTDDKPGNGLTAVIAGNDQLAAYGKLAAAYFIAHSEEGSKIAVFSLSAYPVLNGFTDGVQDAIDTWCPTCSAEVVDQQVTDLGTKTPANVVGYLQRNPDVKWIAFSNGNFASGVTAAIKTAGITGVNIVGQDAPNASIEGVKSGTETAWVGYPLDMLGWRVIDTLARHFEGSELAAPTAVLLPSQILDKGNIDQAVFSNGFYVGVEDYSAQFTKLWLVD